MNKDYLLYNLQEAKEQLYQIIQDLKNNSDYDFGEYIVDMTHLYHHINTAWNAKDSTETESNNCTDEDFYKWRQFPKDIYLGK